MSEQPYQPVSCALHSELELAIMQGSQLLIQCSDATTDMSIKPTDIITRSIEKRDQNIHQQKAEFLAATDISGRQLEIRLDRITKITLLQ